METIKAGKVILKPFVGILVTCDKCYGIFKITEEDTPWYIGTKTSRSDYNPYIEYTQTKYGVSCPTARCGTVLVFYK